MRISKRHFARVIPFCAGFFLWGGSGAAAQEIDSPYRFVETSQSLGLFAGHALTGRGQIGLGSDDSPFLGLRYGLQVTGPFVVEAEAGFLPGTRMVLDTTLTADSAYTVLGEADSRLLSLMASLRFNITGPRTWRGLQPFLLFGGGVLFDIAGANDMEAELPEDLRYDFGTSFAGQIGGGLQWYMTPSTSLRVDARNMLWKVNTPTAFRIQERGRTLPDDEWTQNFVASLGLAIHF